MMITIPVLRSSLISCPFFPVPAFGRDLSLGGDEPPGDLPDLAGLVDVIALCLGEERRGEVVHLGLLEDACSFLLVLEFLCLPD